MANVAFPAAARVLHLTFDCICCIANGYSSFAVGHERCEITSEGFGISSRVRVLSASLECSINSISPPFY